MGAVRRDGESTTAQETTAFHGVLYQMKSNSRKWASLSQGFVTVRIGNDSTGRGSSVMEAQEGSSKVGIVYSGSEEMIDCL